MEYGVNTNMMQMLPYHKSRQLFSLIAFTAFPNCIGAALQNYLQFKHGVFLLCCFKQAAHEKNAVNLFRSQDLIL